MNDAELDRKLTWALISINGKCLDQTSKHIHCPKTWYSGTQQYRCQGKLLMYLVAKSKGKKRISLTSIVLNRSGEFWEETKQFLSLECKISWLRLEGLRDVLYPWVIYFDSPPTLWLFSMSKLILRTRGKHYNMKSEISWRMCYVACHWISFENPFQIICQGLNYEILLFTWDVVCIIKLWKLNN